jgi:hypothetical protein
LRILGRPRRWDGTAPATTQPLNDPSGEEDMSEEVIVKLAMIAAWALLIWRLTA